MADDEIAKLPPTIAQLPFFASGRFPKPDLLGRCEKGVIVKTSGRELLERVREVGLGLQSLGLAPGDRVALLAESRPEWLINDFAILASGGVTVPVYPTLAAEQVGLLFRDSGASLAIASTAEQLDKVLGHLPSLPDLKAIIVTDVDRDALATRLPAAIPIETLQDVAERGHRAIRDGWGVGREFQERAKRVKPADLATIIYTSGTTGEPKGVMLSHANLIADIAGLIERFQVDTDDTGLSFLPLCHGFERMIAYTYMATGVSMIFAESVETVARDLGTVRPTIMTGVPRVYEKLHARVVAAAHDAGDMKRRIFDWANGVALARADVLASGGRLNPWLALQSKLADRLVFQAIRERLGGRFRFAVSVGAPLGDMLGRWFYGIGLPLIEGYGLTETSPVVAAMPLNGIRFGTVGPPLVGFEVRIANDGEVLTRGANVMQGYYRRPAETAAVLRDGWFYTGDIGQLDERGYLHITDRKKELLVTSGGKKIAPQPIEERLRAHDLIGEAVLIGDKRHFPSVLIVPDFRVLGAHLGAPMPPGVPEMAARLARPDVQALYAKAIEDVNAGLAQFERIKAFRLLPREFSQENGELTPTLKVKRRVIEERYRDVIDGMYR